jgi:dienelactone hydrolase
MNTISFLRHWRVCLTFWMLAPLAMAQPYKTLSSSQATLIEFDSENCVGYWTADYKCQPIKIKGYLFTPQQDWSSLVMASHGAQGVDQRGFEYADALIQNGIAALVIDHWTARGINMRSMTYSQAAAKGGTTSSIATDAIWAAAYLQANVPQVKKLGLIGESMGAMAAVQLSKQRMTELFVRKSSPKPFTLPLAAMVGLYPACAERVVGERFINTPFLILSGELDDHTLAKDCVDYESWVNARGGNLKTEIIAGAYHDFDAPHALEFRARGQNVSKCLNIVDDKTITIVASGKVLPNNLEGQIRLPRECSSWGLRSGHGANKFIAVERWLSFLKQHLDK